MATSLSGVAKNKNIGIPQTGQYHFFMMKDVVIFGTGGHAKVVYDILLRQGQYRPVAFFSLEKNVDSFLGLPHYHQDEFQKISYDSGVVAIGDNWIRSKVVEFILKEKSNFLFINAIHPSAQLGEGLRLGLGNVIMANAVVNPFSVLGSHIIVNTTSSVDHDCILEDFSSIAPGAVLGGNVQVGKFSAVSLGANVIHNKKIGQSSVIGAGSLVLSDIEDSVIAYGRPCKVIRSRAQNEKYL